MNIESNRKKWVIIFSILSIVVLCGVGYALYQTWIGREAAISEVGKVQKQLDDIKKIAAQKNMFDIETKFAKSEIIRYSEALPKDILQENVVEMLRVYGEKSDLDITSINLNPMDVTADGIRMTVKIAFLGDYEKVTAFLGMVNANVQKAVVPQLTVAGSEGKVSGSATIVLYGYKDSVYSQSPWDSKLKQGKTDLFRLFEGAPSPQNATIDANADISAGGNLPISATPKPQQNVVVNTPYDVFVVAGPSSDDAPTLVIGKNNLPGSEICADGNKENWVNLYFTEKDGKYYFRYRTEVASYPAGNKTEELMPISGDKIVVKVTGKAKVDGNDVANAIINIENHTKLQVVVKMNQTKGLPRVGINPKKGSVNTMYE